MTYMTYVVWKVVINHIHCNAYVIEFIPQLPEGKIPPQVKVVCPVDRVEAEEEEGGEDEESSVHQRVLVVPRCENFFLLRKTMLNIRQYLFQ